MESINNQSLKESFNENGYVFIPGFLTKEEVKEMNLKLKFFIDEKADSMPAGHVMYEDSIDKGTLKQMQDLNLYDPFFDKILTNSKFTEIAAFLLGEEVIGKTLEYFNKPTKIGKATPPHQDAYYFMINPPNAVTMWMALEEVDEENGCVRYIKGSHLKGIRPHGRTQTKGFSQGITDYGKEDDVETAIPAHPGDLLIHHSLTIHRADGNKSDSRTRKAMGLIYFGESAREDHEALAAYQKKLTEDLNAKV